MENIISSHKNQFISSVSEINLLMKNIEINNNQINDFDPKSDERCDGYTVEKILDLDNSTCKTKSCSSNTMKTLVPMMKNLLLSQEKITNDYKCLAGYITAIIPSIETAVIRLATESKIVDIGTVIFSKTTNETIETSSNEYREIGFISDIFGSVSEPMYSLQLKQSVSNDSLKIDSEVFYLHDNTSTKFITVIREDNGRYVIKN